MKNNVFTAKNVWRDGLIMDLAPDNTQNTVLTSALNATLITFNGNELSLQNDMGNGRVETAMLPEGYIPVGAAELGGIIYIAAHNPLNGQSLLGSFPSPERNLAKEEISDNIVTLKYLDFQELSTIDIDASWNNIKERLGYVSYLKDEGYPYYNVNIFNEYSGEEKEQIINLSINDPRNLWLLKYDNNNLLTTLIKKIDLGMPKLNPGDKFYVGADNIQLEGSTIWNGLTGYINLYLASITNDNKIIPLELEKKKETNHVIGISPTDISNNNDLDAYREILNNTFDIYNIKQSGKIYVIAELVVIDEFNYSYDITDTDIVFTFTWSSKFGEVNPDHIKLTITDEDGTIETTTNNGIYEYKDYSNKSGIVSITATPVMPFGELSHLTLTKNLDLDKINNDYYNLSLWQYYKNEDNSITLNLTTDFYPKEGFKFTEFVLKFTNYTNLEDIKEHVIETTSNGTLDIIINGTVSPIISLTENSFYKVEITVSVVGKDNIPIIKKVSNPFYLYTSNIFNGFYSNNGYIKDGTIYSTKVSSFSDIDHTYGYKDGNKWTYPLQIPVTISNTFEQVGTPTFTHSYNLSEVITETELPLISTDSMTGKYSYNINSTISTNKEGLFDIKGTVKDIKIKNYPIFYTISSNELSDINTYKVTLDNVNHNSNNLTFDLQVIKGTKLETTYSSTTLYKFTNSIDDKVLERLLWLKVDIIENKITTWKVGYFDFTTDKFTYGGTKSNDDLLNYIKDNDIYINNDLIVPFIIGYDDIEASPMYNTKLNNSCKYSDKLLFLTVRLTIDANPISSYKEDEPITINYAIINGENLIFTNNIALLDGKSKNILYEYIYSKFYMTTIELSINDMYENIYKHDEDESIYAYIGDNPCDQSHNIIVSPTIDFTYDYNVKLNNVGLDSSINNLNIKPFETINTDKINIEINNNDLKNAIEEKIKNAKYCDFNGTKYITNNLTIDTKVYIDKVPKPIDKYFKWTKIFKELNNDLEYSCKASWIKDLSQGKIYLNTSLENDGYFLLDNKHKITDLSIKIEITRTGLNTIPLLGFLHVTCWIGENQLVSKESIVQENVNLGPVPISELESESFNQTFTFNVDNISKFKSSYLRVEIPTLNAPNSDSGVNIQFTINIKLENIYNVIESTIGEFFIRDGFGSEIPKPTFYFSPEKHYIDLRTDAYEFKIIDNKLYYAENS